MTGAHFVEIRDYETLETRVQKVEEQSSKTYDMVLKIFYLYFPQVQGQKGMFEEHEYLKARVKVLEDYKLVLLTGSSIFAFILNYLAKFMGL